MMSCRQRRSLHASLPALSHTEPLNLGPSAYNQTTKNRRDAVARYDLLLYSRPNSAIFRDDFGQSRHPSVADNPWLRGRFHPVVRVKDLPPDRGTSVPRASPASVKSRAGRQCSRQTGCERRTALSRSEEHTSEL